MIEAIEKITGGELTASIFGFLFDIIPQMLNIIWSGLCVPAYYLIALFYNVFNTIPQMNLLQHVEIEQIYQRMTMIMVIVMAFYITFEVVKYVVQPDTITDKQKGVGNVAFKMIAVILLIAFVPRIFTLAYDLQGKILNSNVINKVLLGNHVDAKRPLMSTAGSEFAADLFSVFYNLNQEACPVTDDGKIDESYFTNNGVAYLNCKSAQETVNMNLQLLRGGWADNPSTAPIGATLGGLMRSLSLGKFNISGINGGFQFLIDFSGLLAFIVGGVVIWVLIVYGVEVARRYFQLLYLQIMAPIAIIGYLSPKKENTLTKWAKQCITTYLDLFIRIAIINFVILLTNILHDTLFDTDGMLITIFGGSKSFGGTIFAEVMHFDVYIFVYIFLVIGLFMFALKAPKLLQELFPKSGEASNGFGLMDTTKKVYHGASRAIGGVVGAYTGARTAYNNRNQFKTKGDGFLAGAKGALAGAKAGFAKGGNVKKGREAATGSVHKDIDTVLAGGSVAGSTFHGHSNAQEAKGYEREKKRLEEVAKVKDDGKKVGGGHGFSKQAISTVSDLDHREIANADARGAWNKAMEKIQANASVDGNTQTAKSKIESATHELYEAERQKVENEARIAKEVTQNTLDTARNEQQAANDTINHYETFVGPLTEEQMAELAQAQKNRTSTEEKIKAAEEKLKTLEEERLTKLKTAQQEEEDLIAIMKNKLITTSTDTNGNVIETFADADILAQQKNVYQKGYTDSVGTYITADGKEFIIYETEQQARELAQRRAQNSGRTVEEELQEVRNRHITFEEYVENIGKIQDSANTEISNMSINPEVRRAEANAKASGNSGK